MYHGEVTINKDHINQFMEIAQDFEIKGLTKVKDDESIDKDSFGDDQGEAGNVVVQEDEPVDISKHNDKTNIIYATRDEINNYDTTNEINAFDITNESDYLDYQDHNESNDTNEFTKSKSLICQKCGLVFSSQSGFLRHTRTKHEGLLYSCNQCEYKATQPHHLKTHQQAKGSLQN